jgi:hypothetical protein
VSGNTAVFVDQYPGKRSLVATAKQHGTTSGDSIPCTTRDPYDCRGTLFDIHGNEMSFTIRMQPYVTLQGRVFDVATGAGIEGATVQLLNDVTTTGAHGSWSMMPSTQPQSAHVSVTMPGYVVGSFGGAPGDGDAGALVTVTPGVPPPFVAIGLARGGTFSGTVTDEISGAPIAGATVIVAYARGYEYKNDIRAVTDANGHFVTPAVIGARRYSVHASAAGYAASGADGKPCLSNCDYDGVPIDGNVMSDTAINFALRKTGRIDVWMKCLDGSIERPYGGGFYYPNGKYVVTAPNETSLRTVAVGDYYVSGYALCGGGVYPNAPFFSADPDITRIAKPVTVRAGETTYVGITVVDHYPRMLIEPQAAPASGGTMVTFSTGATPSTHVLFGDAEAIVMSIGNNLLQVAAPPHAPGAVDITLKDGKFVDVQHAAFTYTNDCTGISFNRGLVISGPRDAPAAFSADITGGSGPFQYEWFRGYFPSIAEPQATTASFVTDEPLRLIAPYSYWVRVSNPCSVATMSFNVHGVKVRGVR